MKLYQLLLKRINEGFTIKKLVILPMPKTKEVSVHLYIWDHQRKRQWGAGFLLTELHEYMSHEVLVEKLIAGIDSTLYYNDIKDKPFKPGNNH